MRQVSTSSTDRYIFTDVAELDITDAITVKRMVRENNIKVIVNCAAYTDVDRAEDDVCMAELLNATAVRYLAEALKANDGILIHVSTDYVFGSTQQNTPYKEDHPVNPTGVYGLTKLHGEQTIANVDCHHIPYSMALFRIREKLRQDHAAANSPEAPGQSSFRPGGNSHLRL